MQKLAIQVEGLQKSFKGLPVLKGVDFGVEKGTTVFLTTQYLEEAGVHFLPVILISSAFVPTATMPPAVRVFAENQPVTSVVETIRPLLSNQPAGDQLWLALAWCGGIVVFAYVLAMRVYRRTS